MDPPAYGVLRGKFGKIKSSNVNPAWLGERLYAANIIGQEEKERARSVDIAKSERLGELVDSVLGNGGRGVFETFVNILFSQPHLRWLADQLKGRYS